MQAFFCDVVRARTKLGMAIAASRPMIATTIMISTRVNPCVRLRLICILYMYFSLLLLTVRTAPSRLAYD